ncbi:permease prefix domain 1-containing protein [Neobacillus sp. NPDC093127]|uniref:permease prefix domain 1-containing protein n=1 Tax=Neobacillus sp. NPDC093127 TaxID=3364296 RepID=UPI00382DF3F1
MNELKKYVDHLFRKYKNHRGISDLKDEILGNLEAKVSHLMEEGLNEREAIAKAKSSITKIDDLIDDNIPVWINQFRFKAFQITYIYILIAWIVTIPFSLLSMGLLLNYGLLFVCLVLGIFYLFLAKNVKRNEKKIAELNLAAFTRAKKITWLLWLLFIIVIWGYLSAILFGSNIWFSRPVHIDGPYQFGILIARYALPFISIVIPLILKACIRLIPQYEVRDFHE